jgi:hypothetical protein
MSGLERPGILVLYCVNRAIHCFITVCVWVSGRRHTSHQSSLLPTLLLSHRPHEKGVDGSVWTNGACQPDSFCLALHYLGRDWVWEGMPVDTAAPFVAQMADADPPLAETMATLQRKIRSLEETIEKGNDELERKGHDFEYRAQILKPKEEQLVQMRKQLVELEIQKRITMEQQLRTQEGTPCLCLAHYPLPRVHL